MKKIIDQNSNFETAQQTDHILCNIYSRCTEYGDAAMKTHNELYANVLQEEVNLSHFEKLQKIVQSKF